MKDIIGKKLNLKKLFVILISGLLFLPASSQPYKVRMAMVGNSITYGAELADPSTESYPAQLNNILAEIYGDTCEVINYGVGGKTMSHNTGRSYWDNVAFSNAIKFVPDICLIALGTNDAKVKLWQTIEFAKDYQAMLDTFKVRNPYTKFILCLPPPIWEGHIYAPSDPHNDSILVNNVIPIIDSIAQANATILLDFHSYFLDSLSYFPDKLHPSAEGSKIMADIIFEKVQELDLIHEVDAGYAFISSFMQSNSSVSEGSSAQITWSTLFADSVFFEGVLVDSSGSIDVIAEAGKDYTLVAKGDKNTSTLTLKLQTYIPAKSKIDISTSSSDYKNGGSVVFYTKFCDQKNKEMKGVSSNITWTIIEGEGEFGEKTDTSIVFTPLSIDKIILEAKEGEISQQKILYVDKLSALSQIIETNRINVYPNPFSDRVNIEFTSLSSDDVQLLIYNVNGQLVKRVEFKNLMPGTNQLMWDGSDNSGSILPDGMYMIQIRQNNNINSRTVLLHQF